MDSSHRRIRRPILLLLLFALSGCRSAPEEAPPPPPPAMPESSVVTAPEPPEAPPEPQKPRPQAPLEGPRWVLESMYGTSRMAVPPAGSVWVEFDPAGEEPQFRAFTGIEEIMGSYSAGPRDQLVIQSVRFPDASSGTRRFIPFREQLAENIALVKGYYIQGAVYEESRLFLYGGVGREEIILAEFLVAEEGAER